MTRLPITPTRSTAGPGEGRPIARPPQEAAGLEVAPAVRRAAVVRDLRTRAGHDRPRADLDFLWRALIT